MALIDHGDKRPSFTTSLETQLLIERLRQMEAGEVVNYNEFSDLISQNVQHEGYAVMKSARDICQRDYQIVTAPVYNVGIKRLTDPETIASGADVCTRVRRAAKRGIDRITAVSDFNSLSDADKLRHNATISGLALIRMLTRPRALDRIASAVNTAQTGQLPIARTLELFRDPKDSE